MFGLTIDAFLRNFLMHSWTYVIERAERTQDPQAIRFRQLVPELLWSIVPRTAADSRSELLGLLPNIVRTIRNGLMALEWDSARQQDVLDWLVQAHRSVLRGVPDATPAPTLQSMRQHFAHFIAGAEEELPLSAVESADVIQQQVFLDQAIRDADGATAHSSGLTGASDLRLAGQSSATALPESAAIDALTPGVDGSMMIDKDLEDDDPVGTAMLAHLRTGVAVTLKLGDVAGKAQLTWIDQKKSTLVLSIEGQPAPVLISMRMFRRMYNSGRLMFVETAPLFERAIASVQHSAASM